MVVDPHRALGPQSFKDLFVAHYDAIRDLCEDYRRRGLAVAVLHAGGVAGTARLAAKRGSINAGIIGRHGACDLYLDGDPSLSLRHLAVILHPEIGGEDLRFRIVDLRTAAAFFDEHGRRLEALEAEGPLFIRCGEHAVFFFPTTDEIDPWPDDAEEAWECVPERVYLDDVPAEPDRWLRRRLKALWGQHDPSHDAGDPRRRTLVQTIRGPSRARRSLLAEEDEPMGELEIVSPDGQSTITLGRVAAREGVLFGRYERCDNDGLPVLCGGRISRVHLLVLEIAGMLYAIDTASSNGVWCGEEEVRLVPLTSGTTLTLGENLARVRWTTKGG
jgi:hypothetical protein